MINIVSVEWRNFLGYGDYSTRVDGLDSRGPTLIMGVNGAGKSTIISAIVWCLFGRTVKRAKPGDNILNWDIKRDCYVEIETSDGWRIKRTRKMKGHDDLIVYNADKDETRGTNDQAQKFLNEEFALDYDIFVASSFFLQNSTVFLDMGDAKRKDALERLLGIDRLNIWATVAKEKGKVAEADYEDLQKTVSRLKDDVDRYRRAVEENKVKSEEFEGARATKIAALKAEVEQCAEAISHIDQEAILKAGEQWEQVDDLAADLERLQNRITLIDSEINNQRHRNELSENAVASAAEHLEHLPSEEDIKRYREQYVVFASRAAEIRAKADGRRKKVERLAGIKNRVALLEAGAEQDAQAAFDLAQQMSLIEDPKAGRCPACAQPIASEEVERQKKANEARRSEIQAAAMKKGEGSEKKKEEAAALARDVSTLEEEILNDPWDDEKVSAEIADLMPKYDEAELDDKERQRRQRRDTIIEKKAEIQQGVEFMTAKEEEKAEIQKSVSQKAAEIEEIRPSIARDELIAKGLELSTLIEKKADRERQMEEEASRANPFAEVAKSESLRASQTQEEIEKHEGSLHSLMQDMNHYAYLYKAYSDRRKIKSMIIGELIPFFNKRIAYYISAFECDIDLEFTPSLGYSTGKWPYDLCSGGEQKRVSVAVMFAMHDLYLAIYGRQCNVMALDEVDTALDHEGAQAFQRIVNNDFAEKRPERPTPDTIFVISHRDDMVDAFPAKIVCSRDDSRFSHIAEDSFAAVAV